MDGRKSSFCQLTFCLIMNYLWSFATTKRVSCELKIFSWSHAPKRAFSASAHSIILLSLYMPGHPRVRNKVLNTCSHVVGEVGKD